jgi:hypothetical protein
MKACYCLRRYANRLLGVTRDEEAGRLAIVDHRPRSDREARLKLAYMAAYLIATRGTLNANEMNSVLEAPRYRPKHSFLSLHLPIAQ